MRQEVYHHDGKKYQKIEIEVGKVVWALIGSRSCGVKKTREVMALEASPRQTHTIWYHKSIQIRIEWTRLLLLVNAQQNYHLLDMVLHTCSGVERRESHQE